MRRFWACLLALLLPISALADTTLAYWDASATERLEEAVGYFRKKYDGLPVTLKRYDSAESCLSAFLTGERMDVLALDGAMLDALPPGLLTDVEIFAKNLALENFSELPLVSLTRGGKLRGVPLSAKSRVFFWNGSLLGRAGISLPASAGELIGDAAALRAFLGANSALIAADAEARAALVIERLQSQYGRDWLSPETGAPDYAAPEVAEAMHWLSMLQGTGVLWPYGTQGDALARLASGRCAAVYASCADAARIAVPGDDKLAVTPQWDDGLPFDGVLRSFHRAFAIPERTLDKSAAVLLVSFLLHTERGARSLGDAFGVPDSEDELEFARDHREVNDALFAADKVADGRYPEPVGFAQLARSGAFDPVFEALDSLGADEAAARLLALWPSD